MADETVVKGTLYCIAGDNLGSHCVGGFTENFSSSTYFCRYCLISRTEFQGNDPTSCGPERTTERYKSAVDQLETEDVPDVQGIKFRFRYSNSNLSVSLSSFYMFHTNCCLSLNSLNDIYLIVPRRQYLFSTRLGKQFPNTLTEAP
ncbi:hypothetical protein NFI96_008700 [Prochilodus magdalenae]|nr:hypothetical protein NFI96_008700 [Prochilodus magdalenae]